MTTIQTLFGTFNEEQLKALKGALDEMNDVMFKQEQLSTSMKDSRLNSISISITPFYYIYYSTGKKESQVLS